MRDHFTQDRFKTRWLNSKQVINDWKTRETRPSKSGLQDRSRVLHVNVYLCMFLHLTDNTQQRIFVGVWGGLSSWGIVAHRELIRQSAADWAPRRGLSPWLQGRCWEIIALQWQDVLPDSKVFPPHSAKAWNREDDRSNRLPALCSSSRYN